MPAALRILVEYRGRWGLGDLVCSEPLIRTLRELHGPSAEIRWRGHAGNAAHCPAFDGEAPNGFVPDHVVAIELFDRMPLERYAELEALPSLVQHMASYAGVMPIDQQPRLHLGPEELWFEQKLGIWRLPRPLVAICADGSDPYRAWPVARFRALAQRVQELGGTVLELGVRERLGVGADFVGKLTIRQSAALLSGCDLFVGNNSGLLHYAQAADVPALGLFSVALPERFVHDDRMVVPVQLEELACIDCMTRDFAGRNRDGCRATPEAVCMQELPLELALAILETIFAEYLSDCPRRGHEGPRARAFRARIYAERAARLLARGHTRRAGAFLAFAQERLPQGEELLR